MSSPSPHPQRDKPRDKPRYKLCHTADWHLGHTLHGHSRAYEHDRFLEWLLDALEEEQADALLIAGDVYDRTNPPAQAQAQLYRFLAEARRRMPRIAIVAVAGNHDSAARLSAPDPILRSFGVRVIGSLPRLPEGTGAEEAAGIDHGELVIPLYDARGALAARVLAVPYLRPSDLPEIGPGESPLADGTRRFYARTIEAAERAPERAPLLAMGHCHMADGRMSELSERRILGGLAHALPVDIFPEELAYVALGHLHLAQSVGGRDTVRYSGSPIPLSMPERGYRHQVHFVELDGRGVYDHYHLRVPRFVEVLRVPTEGPSSPTEMIRCLELSLSRMDLPRGLAAERRPFLELRVRLERPEPQLRRRVEEVLEGKAIRLAKISVEYSGDHKALGDVEADRELADLTVDQVFERRYARDYESPVPDALMAAFHELVDAAAQREGA